MRTIATSNISYTDLVSVSSGKCHAFKTNGNVSVSSYLDKGVGRLDYAQKEILYSFVDNKELNGVVYSYNTPIAIAVNGTWRMLYARYSATSSKSFNIIARVLGLPTLAENDKRQRDLYLLDEEGLLV